MPVREHEYNLRPSLEWVSNPGGRATVGNPLLADSLPAEFVFGEDEEIVDQLNLGSCTANMAAEVFEYLQKAMGLKTFRLSRLAQYYFERVLEGSIQQDAGATIADTVKAMQDGVAPEDLWPYVNILSNFTQKPPPSVDAARPNNKLIEATMLSADIATQKAWLYNHLPIGYGFTVYGQYEGVGADGMIAMPNGQALGGHANSKWGWSDARGAWRIHNVWGPGWGDKGRGWLPYGFPIWDVWGMSKVSGVVVPTPGPTPDPTPGPTPPPSPVSLTLAAVDDKAGAHVSLSWNNGGPTVGSYKLGFGLSSNVLSQSINVGKALVLNTTYARDGKPRYGRVQALAADGSTVLGTSNIVSFGPATPTPSPTPAPTPTPTPQPGTTEVKRPDGGSFSPPIFVKT